MSRSALHRPVEGLALAQTLPKGSIPRTKSARDQFWLNHLRALHEQDQPLSAYAQAHGLSPGSLYRARARLEDSERTLPHHGVELERFGEVVSEQLDIVPAKMRVLRHIRGKYCCPWCEGHLRTAAMPAQPLPKSFASPGLLAFIVTAKYVDALPLYRQHRPFVRIGVELSRTTLARWMVRMGELVVALINVLRDELVERAYLLMDETTVQVLKEPGKAPESKSQLWAMMSPGPEPPIVVFEYDPTRSGDVPKRLLAGFAGALHTDGYSGYAPVVREQGLVHLACWAHGRHGFIDVLKSLGVNPKKLPSAAPAKARRALHALQQIRTLYAIERRIPDEPPEERHRGREPKQAPWTREGLRRSHSPERDQAPARSTSSSSSRQPATCCPQGTSASKRLGSLSVPTPWCSKSRLSTTVPKTPAPSSLRASPRTPITTRCTKPSIPCRPSRGSADRPAAQVERLHGHLGLHSRSEGTPM